MTGEHLVHPWVVTAAVVDHQGGVGDRGGVGRTYRIRMRIDVGAGQDGPDGEMAAGDRTRHAAPHVGGGHQGD